MSITSRISSMEEHVTNAYNGLQGLGADLTGIDKNIDNIAQVLDNIYDDLPKVTGSGTSITLEDTRVGKIKSTLKGNTSQTTYSGKNLLHQDQYITTKTVNGITFTNNGDGTFNVSGTANADTNINILTGASQIGLESGKTYYLYSSQPYNPSTFNLSIPYTQDGSQKYLTANNRATTSGTIDNIKLAFYVASGTTINAQNVKVMLVEGSTPGDYEPYVGGTASPNPSYPQDIHVVSGDNEINVGGKNLFRIGKTSSTQNGVTYSYNEDETLNLSGTATGTTYFSVTEAIDNTCIVNGESYKFSINKTIPSGIRFKIELYNGTSYVREYYVENSSSPATISINLSNITSIRYVTQVNNGATTNISNVGVQLEKGNSATSFMPFSRDTYPINLPVENLFDDSTLNNKWVAQNGTITSATGANCIKYNCNANDTYTLSATFGTSSANNIIVMAFYNSSDTLLNRYVTTTNTSLTMTYTAPANTSYMYAGHYGIVPTTIQLEKGSKQNNFTPYGTTPIELCKIGDYQDYFYKDSGKWYLHKEIGKAVLNGSSDEIWTKSGATTENSFVGAFNLVTTGISNKWATGSSWLCDKFVYGSLGVDYKFNTYNGDATQGYIFFGITIPISLAGDINAFRTWLGNNNVTLYYVLKEPIATEITDATLKSQLEALRNAESYEGQTNISQTNNDLPFIISASALKKWSE